MGAVNRLVAAAAAFSAVLGGCGGDDPAGVPCEELGARLAAASDGDVVRLGACRAEGSFTVPAGVTLAGAGAGETVVAGPAEDAVLTLGANARLEDLTVEASRGVAVDVDGVAARLARVTLVGPITEANATAVPPTPDPAETATHGLLVTSAGSTSAPVQLEDVAARGFARFGVLSLDSFVRWVGGSASDNLGVGVMARGGEIELVGVELCRTLQGVRPMPAYAGVFSAGVAVTTSSLTVCDNEGFGLLHDGARTLHANLVGAANSEPALWVQQEGTFELTGSESVLSGNRIAGLVLIDVADATVRDAQIDDTELARRLVDGLGDVEAGDGIQVVAASTAGLRIESVALGGNQRVGVLFDLPSAATVDDATLSGVTVEATGDALGVVAQTPEGPLASGSWDSAVTRAGAAADNDATFAGHLDTVGIVGPMYIPPVD